MKILIIGADSYVGARIYLELQKKYETAGTYYSDKTIRPFLVFRHNSRSRGVQVNRRATAGNHYSCREQRRCQMVRSESGKSHKIKSKSDRIYRKRHKLN